MCLLQLPLFPLLPSPERGDGDNESGSCGQSGDEKLLPHGHGWCVVEAWDCSEEDIKSVSSILEVELFVLIVSLSSPWIKEITEISYWEHTERQLWMPMADRYAVAFFQSLQLSNTIHSDTSRHYFFFLIVNIKFLITNF